jgi:hypothetical protein
VKPEDVLSDPDFHGLPHIERLKVLYKLDPEYRRLHPRERWKVVKMIPTPPPQGSNAPNAPKSPKED